MLRLSQIRGYENGIWGKKNHSGVRKSRRDAPRLGVSCDNSQSKCLIHTLSFTCWSWLGLWRKSSDLRANSSAFLSPGKGKISSVWNVFCLPLALFLLEPQISFKHPSQKNPPPAPQATSCGRISLGILPEHILITGSPRIHCSISFKNIALNRSGGNSAGWVFMFVHTVVARYARHRRFALHFWRQSIKRKRQVPKAISNSEQNLALLGSLGGDSSWSQDFILSQLGFLAQNRRRHSPKSKITENIYMLSCISCIMRKNVLCLPRQVFNFLKVRCCWGKRLVLPRIHKYHKPLCWDSGSQDPKDVLILFYQAYLIDFFFTYISSLFAHLLSRKAKWGMGKLFKNSSKCIWPVGVFLSMYVFNNMLGNLYQLDNCLNPSLQWTCQKKNK